MSVRIILTNLLGTIVFIPALTLSAPIFQATPNLCSNTCAIANLQSINFLTNCDNAADDFVAGAEREWHHVLAPARGRGVKIGTADTAGDDFQVDIVGFEFFGFKLGRVLSGGEISLAENIPRGV